MPPDGVSVLYRWLTRLARRFAPVLARSGSKLARGLEGRAAAHEELAAWGRTERDDARPLVWFHAPSVGEGLQAQAVMEAVRARRPGVQVAFTHFSPSAEALARRIGADVSSYLPWDLPGPSSTALEGLRPSLVAFTKTEVWPVLTEEASRRGVPVALVAGSVPEGAGRARWPARALLRSTWRRLELVCANSEADAQRLVALGVAADAVHVTGDPGIDSAARRADSADPGAPHLAPFHGERVLTVVAGSTWPADERVLVPAVGALRASLPGLRLVLAPHEPKASVVEGLLGTLGGAGWRATTLSGVVERGSVEGHDAVVVDSVGVLAHLYTVGDVAFVGGGFHDAGLHSVLEPAAARLPVVFGPRHQSARAAGELVSAGGAKIAEDAPALKQILSTWLGDEAARTAAGKGGFAYIERHRGAAARTAELLDTRLP